MAPFNGWYAVARHDPSCLRHGKVVSSRKAGVVISLWACPGAPQTFLSNYAMHGWLFFENESDVIEYEGNGYPGSMPDEIARR